MKAPGWVTFDCYGTLINWDAGINGFFTDLLHRKGCMTVPAADLRIRWEQIQFDLIRGVYRPYKEILKLSLRAVLSEVNVAYEETDGNDFVESLKGWAPFPDVPQSLERLRRFCRIAIVSNIDRDLLGHSVALMGVPFDALITAEDARTYKPNRRIFEFALSHLGCEPMRVLHVAFGYRYDLGPAREVGMKTCWLDRGGEKLPLGFQADFVAMDLTEVVALVEALTLG